MLAFGVVLLSLSASPVTLVADGVPRFDIAASCEAAGKSSTGIGRPVAACRDDEEKARGALEMRWSEFPVQARTTCTEGASLGGPPSYVQLITCLEMTKQ
ncbi:hypothetical protein [Bosea sp. NBC_00550]|uniref:hypothetical protein n=1 Tax=Bosea sp. NBC_00550 TaxID=2969621 RepID=UPI00222E139D|nr:hypothetical protein [Bosea sp. NBC_00550]UZF93829.1 hypothetical protein NWE53_06460 [Bosea sp. NBC_00550]